LNAAPNNYRFGGITVAGRSGRKEKEEKPMIKTIGAVLMSAVFFAFMSTAGMAQATKPEHPAKPEHPKAEQTKPDHPQADSTKPDHPQTAPTKPEHPKSEHPKSDHPKQEHPK
jgi:hypothetical protein